MSDRAQREAAATELRCSCPECLKKYHAAKAARDPYYRPRTEPRESDSYERCRRDPYDRDRGDGSAGN